MPKNITLAIDEDVLADVRRYAAEHNTTVNALVRTALESIADRSRRLESEWDELFALTQAAGARVGPRTGARENLHDRS